MKVRIARQAARDLDDIGDRIALDDPDIAGGFVEALRAKALGIAELPQGYPKAGRWRGFDVRKRTHESYLIFYYIARDSIIVIRFLHASRDYSRLF